MLNDLKGILVFLADVDEELFCDSVLFALSYAELFLELKGEDGKVASFGVRVAACKC